MVILSDAVAIFQGKTEPLKGSRFLHYIFYIIYRFFEVSKTLKFQGVADFVKTKFSPPTTKFSPPTTKFSPPLKFFYSCLRVPNIELHSCCKGALLSFVYFLCATPINSLILQLVAFYESLSFEVL